jgi:hypothetical protein
LIAWAKKMPALSNPKSSTITSTIELNSRAGWRPVPITEYIYAGNNKFSVIWTAKRKAPARAEPGQVTGSRVEQFNNRHLRKSFPNRAVTGRGHWETSAYVKRCFRFGFVGWLPSEISVRTSSASLASLNSRRRVMFWRAARARFSSSSRIEARWEKRRSLFALAVCSPGYLFIRCPPVGHSFADTVEWAAPERGRNFLTARAGHS